MEFTSLAVCFLLCSVRAVRLGRTDVRLQSHCCVTASLWSSWLLDACCLLWPIALRFSDHSALRCSLRVMGCLCSTPVSPEPIVGSQCILGGGNSCGVVNSRHSERCTLPPLAIVTNDHSANPAKLGVSLLIFLPLVIVRL